MFVLGYLLFLSIFSSYASAQTNSPELRRKLSDLYSKSQEALNGKAKIRIVVRSLPEGGDVFASGESDLVHIASLQKLYLTYAALNILGSEYHFPTEFFTDNLVEDLGEKFDAAGGVLKRSRIPITSLGNLYIRGYGNPSMLHENIFQIGRELKARGLDSIQDLVVDDTLFVNPSPPIGSSPFEAGNSANSVEFNSYRVNVKGALVGEKPIVTLSPGIIAKMENRARTFTKPGLSLEMKQSPDNSELSGKNLGKLAINFDFFRLAIDGRIGAGDPLFEKYLAHPFPAAYYGASFKDVFGIVGIPVKGVVKLDEVPEGAKLIYTHESKPLYEILTDLNHFSSNFIAGQILYAIGQEENGRFSKEQGLKNLDKEIRNIKNYAEGITLIDGSGLDKGNKSTLNLLVSLIEKVYVDPLLAPTFISSLSRYGVSGTLKSRSILKDVAPVWTSIYEEDKKRSESIWAKTGTVDGISGVAGLAPGFNNITYSFAIVIEGDLLKEEAVKIEDAFVGVISGVSK